MENVCAVEMNIYTKSILGDYMRCVLFGLSLLEHPQLAHLLPSIAPVQAHVDAYRV